MAVTELVFNRQNGVTGAVWRDGDVVHKVLRADGDPGQWPPSDDPRAWNYWRREELAYTTGLPVELGLPAPDLLDVRPAADGRSVELLLRAVPSERSGWPSVDDLVAASRMLGRSQAVPAADRDWLSRGFLADYTRIRPVDWSLIAAGAELWTHPFIAPHFDADLQEGVRRLHAHAADLVAICAALPRTIAHLDAFPANVLPGEDRLHFIDWAFTGDAALGEDIGNLVPDSVFDLFIDPADLGDLAVRAPAAYLAGLVDGGWAGDPRLVELGVKASVVRYEWLMPMTLARTLHPVQTSYGGVPTDTPERNYAARAAGLALCVRWADEAIDLAATLRREGVLG